MNLKQLINECMCGVIEEYSRNEANGFANGLKYLRLRKVISYFHGRF